MDDAAHPKTWRAWFMAFFVLGVVVTFADVIVNVTVAGSTGIGTEPTRAPFVERVVSTFPHSPVHVGDLIDLRTLSAADRLRWQFPRGFRRGQSIALTVTRNGRSTNVTVVAGPPLSVDSPLASLASWAYWLGTLGGLWMNVFAAIIAWRRPASREARVLAMLLLLIPIGAVFADWRSGPPAISMILYALASVLYSVGGALLATYAMLFRPASRVRTLLAWSTYALWTLAVVEGCALIFAVWTLRIDPNGALLNGMLTRAIIGLLPFVFPVLCGAVAIAETHGAERARLAWTMASLGLFYLLLGADNMLSDDRIGNALGNIGFFIAPLGLTYGLLNRKLLDVGFALNRAAIFTAVSVTVVGIFVLLEWAFGEWLQGASHAANVAVSGGLALVLGFSVRFVHGRVEHVVDNVFFRKRHADEAALRAFAHEAGYINNSDTLVARTVAVIERYADSSSVELAVDDGAGRYGDVNEDDPAIVALRAWNKPVDLHAVQTALRGELAFPMAARGRLIGALVLGPKRSGETYAPDESDTIVQIAHSVGTSLAVLDRKAPVAGDALEALGQRLESRITAEIRALGQRLDALDRSNTFAGDG